MRSTVSVSGWPGVLSQERLTHLPFDVLRVIDVDAEAAIELRHQVGDPPGIVIEHGDIAARHVGDVDFVPDLAPDGSACRPC